MNIDMESVNKRPLRSIRNAFERFGFDIESIISNLEENSTVLDICCGRGVAIDEIATKYDHINALGVDIASYVNNDQYVHFTAIQADATNLPLKDNSVDFLYSYMGIPYIADTLKMFEEAYRVLKPNSIGLIGCQNGGQISKPDFRSLQTSAISFIEIGFPANTGLVVVDKNVPFNGFDYKLVGKAESMSKIQADFVTGIYQKN